MDKDLILLLNEILGEEVEELEDEELEEIEATLDKEQQKKFQEALQTFFDNSDEVPSVVNRAAADLAALVIRAPKEEEERGKKKVEKSPSWSFNLGIPRED